MNDNRDLAIELTLITWASTIYSVVTQATSGIFILTQTDVYLELMLDA